MVVYQLAKVVKGTSPNYTEWNSQTFADNNIQMKDPEDPSGPNLTLCQLFEKGVINEVWCMATQNQTKCGETQETKVVYSNADPPVKTTPPSPSSASNGDDVTEPQLQGVDPHHRLQHVARRRLPPARHGPRLGTLHGHAGAAAPAQAGGAVPELGSQHARDGAVQQLLQRLQQQRLAAHRLHRLGFADRGPFGRAARRRRFNISDMSGGCGNAHFYANTTGTYSYDANTPDPMVLSSCEHYGLHDGASGKDMTTPYTNKMTDDLARAQQTGPCTAGSPYCSTEDDCGGHGTCTCIRASRATARRRRTTTARPCTTGGCTCSTRRTSQRPRVARSPALE